MSATGINCRCSDPVAFAGEQPTDQTKIVALGAVQKPFIGMNGFPSAAFVGVRSRYGAEHISAVLGRYFAQVAGTALA